MRSVGPNGVAKGGSGNGRDNTVVPPWSGQQVVGKGKMAAVWDDQNRLDFAAWSFQSSDKAFYIHKWSESEVSPMHVEFLHSTEPDWAIHWQMVSEVGLLHTACPSFCQEYCCIFEYLGLIQEMTSIRPFDSTFGNDNIKFGMLDEELIKGEERADKCILHNHIWF